MAPLQLQKCRQSVLQNVELTSHPNGVFADELPPPAAAAKLTFGEWAKAKSYAPPGPRGYTPRGRRADWDCDAAARGGITGITSVDGVNDYTNLRSLNLDSNEISSLAANAFQGLTNLERLSIEGNQISSLNTNAFEGLTNLQRLELRRNGISSLDNSPFRDLTNLKWLVLSFNKISSVNASSFKGLENLQRLSLYGQRIYHQSTPRSLHQSAALSLEPSTFWGLTNLQTLLLQLNNILSLAPNQFQGLTNLQILNLSSNQISSLDLTSFEASALTHFNIRENPITEVILANTTLSQRTFDTLMTGSEQGVPTIGTPPSGIAKLPGIASVDFTAADMTGVDQFDTMFSMASLDTLILRDVVFSDAIVTGGYAKVWDLISALELNQLETLIVDRQLYTAMQTNLDAWGAGPNNVLTVVPTVIPRKSGRGLR